MSGLFLRFPNGNKIKSAGLTVIRMTIDGPTVDTTFYDVVYHCCGKTEQGMSHKRIRVKRTRKRNHCPSCAARIAAKRSIKARGIKPREKSNHRKDYQKLIEGFGGTDYPSWPVPNVQLPSGWMPR